MKIKREGLIWTAKQAADYLGLSIREVESLMSFNDLGSFRTGHTKRLLTTKKLCDEFLSKLEESTCEA